MYGYIIKSVFLCISICFNKIYNSTLHWIVKFFQDVRCYTIPRFTYWLPHLFFYMAFGYQSLASLYTKRSLWYSSLANSPVILEWVFSLHPWNVLVLWELWHGATSCIKLYLFCGNTTHHIIFQYHGYYHWIVSLWYLALSMSIYFSLKRQASAANGSTDLHTYWQFYSSLNTISMIFLILFAPNATMASIVMIEKYILCHSISLKELEHSLNVTKYPSSNNQGICQKLNSIENVWSKMKKRDL